MLYFDLCLVVFVDSENMIVVPALIMQDKLVTVPALLLLILLYKLVVLWLKGR